MYKSKAVCAQESTTRVLYKYRAYPPLLSANTSGAPCLHCHVRVSTLYSPDPERDRERERELSPLSGTPRAAAGREEPEAGAEEHKKRTPNTRHAAPGSRTARDGKSATAQAPML